MHLIQQVAAASAFASIVAAAPYPSILERSSNVTGAAKFTVPQGPPKLPGKKIAGPIALARVYGKYASIGANAPPKVNAAASKAAGTDDGTVVASPEQYDQAYLEAVSIGGQTLNLDFDTGSSDLYGECCPWLSAPTNRNQMGLLVRVAGKRAEWPQHLQPGQLQDLQSQQRRDLEY